MPPTIVATTFPLKLQPSNGVFFDFERDCEASKVHFFFGIEDGDVGVRALRQSASAFQAEDLRGIRRQQLDNPRQRQLEVLMQNGDGDRQRGFQAGDAEGGALELDLLLVEGVRRVVGGDGVDGAVDDALDQGIAIGGRAQRRIHLVVAC